MPFVESLDEFLQESDFAVGAVYVSAANGLLRTVVGIFDREYMGVLGMEGSAPSFLCKASDVSGLAHGDSFMIDGVEYKSVGNEPDGTGFVRVKLQLQ